MSVEQILKTYGKQHTYDLIELPYQRYQHITGNINHNLHKLLFYIEK